MISLAGAPDLKRGSEKAPVASAQHLDNDGDDFGSFGLRHSPKMSYSGKASRQESSENKKAKKKKENENRKEKKSHTQNKRNDEKRMERKKSSSESKLRRKSTSPAHTSTDSFSSSMERLASNANRFSSESPKAKSTARQGPSTPSTPKYASDVDDEVAYDEDFEEELTNGEDAVGSEKFDDDEDDGIPPSAAVAAPAKVSREVDRHRSSSFEASIKGRKQDAEISSFVPTQNASFSSSSLHAQPQAHPSTGIAQYSSTMALATSNSSEESARRELAAKELALAAKERELESRQRQLELEREIQQLKLQQQFQNPPFMMVGNASAISGSHTGAMVSDSHLAEMNSLQKERVNRKGVLEYRYLAAQRRRRRERERAMAQKREEEERAAHAMFQRLAQDVRDVFHELNLSVVSAEKERLMKDDRYRKEREMKDQREAAERAEKLQKELQERAEREENWWQRIAEREEKFAAKVQFRLQQEESEREDRLRRDLEDRAIRLRNERELHENLDKLEKERRAKNDEEARQRESILLQTQLTEMKTHFHEQAEELRHQMELDRTHGEELHKLEIAMMERRHEAAMEKLQQQHAHQIAVVESYVNHSSKLEKLTTQIHEEMESSKRLHDQVTEERLSTLHEKEKLLEERESLLGFMMKDVGKAREDLETERTRMASLAAKFDISVSQCSRNAEEDRRLFQEAFSRHETLRQQIEKDRKIMISEVAHERKVLEQQHEEFLARKMEMINEVHSERSLLAKERCESNAARERQNREESSLLQSLHAREEEYRTKLASMEENYLKVQEMKIEQKQLLDEVALERDKLREERTKFELEKQELLHQFTNLRIRAEESGAVQQRLRDQLIQERVAREKQSYSNFDGEESESTQQPVRASAASASRFQIDLAIQRGILQKMKAR